MDGEGHFPEHRQADQRDHGPRPLLHPDRRGHVRHRLLWLYRGAQGKHLSTYFGEYRRTQGKHVSTYFGECRRLGKTHVYLLW